MLKQLLSLMLCILCLNLSYSKDPSTKTLNEIINSLDITISKKFIIISTQCQGIPADSEQAILPKCDKTQILTQQIINRRISNKENFCRKLQKSFETYVADCIPYCTPCKYQYSE